MPKQQLYVLLETASCKRFSVMAGAFQQKHPHWHECMLVAACGHAARSAEAAARPTGSSATTSSVPASMSTRP